MRVGISYEEYRPLFESYGITDLDAIVAAWREPGRYYHGEQHLCELLAGIEEYRFTEVVTDFEANLLVLVAFFHDLVHDPMRFDNEERSAARFRELATKGERREEVERIILDSRFHHPSSRLSALFLSLDMNVVLGGDWEKMLKWEEGIRMEYRHYDTETYRQRRGRRLEQWARRFPTIADKLLRLRDRVYQNS